MVCARKSWSAGAAFRVDWSLREVLLVGAKAADLRETMVCARKSWSAGAAFRGDSSLCEVLLVGAEAADLRETLYL
jgi:hypothetical protein